MKKIDKADAKEDGKVDKLIGELEETITKEIKDAKRNQNIISQLKKFTVIVEDFIDECQVMNFKDNEIVRNKNATWKDLDNFYKLQTELKFKGAVEYFNIV